MEEWVRKCFVIREVVYCEEMGLGLGSGNTTGTRDKSLLAGKVNGTISARMG